MHMQREVEIRENFESFQQVVTTYLPGHEGEFVLMHNRAVVEVFERLIDAVCAGHSRFHDGMFSVQEVTTTALDLGFFSHANPERRVCQ